MKFIQLTEKEKVGVSSIDEQHENMARLLNSLYNLLGSGKKLVSQQLLKDLLEEARRHFETEENYMKQSGFKNYISHKLEHDRYYRKLEEFYQKVKEGRDEVNLEMLNSSKRWLLNHFELNDKKLGEYLYEQGER